jgi:diguanylate cyclase (GGDEF)-like protein
VKILVADDSPTALALISNLLYKLGHEVIAVSSGQAAITMFQQIRPDLIILDALMDDIDGFECARMIRTIDNNDWIPIIFLSGSVDDESIAKGIEAGGDDYLTKPFSDITLAAKIKAMQRISDMRQKLFETTQKLDRLSGTDTLTGISNRLQFNKCIPKLIDAADRSQSTLALFILDVDNFKEINDKFGHLTGDALLIEVANRLGACVRNKDFIFRLGGDEFAIALDKVYDTKIPEQIAERVVKALSEEYHLGEHYVQRSVSVGIAFYPQNASNQTELIAKADIALYQAKECGKNKYSYYTD